MSIPPASPAPAREVQNRIYHVAQRQARYLLTTVHAWDANPELRLLTESKSGEHWIRPNSGAVEGFAFLHRFGPYDEAVVGVSRAALLTNTIIPMMRYLVTTHVTGTQPTSDGKKWGDAWQSAHWAHMLGRGAWFVWADLPEPLRRDVRRVVAHEADRIAGAEPPHQMRSDTKAEENAWNSQILSVALLLLPDDSRQAKWASAHQKWVMSSFLRPADEHNDTVVDGRTVRSQFTGANIFNDFTLENHNFVHPDYMTTFSLSLGCAPDFLMSGRRVPEALLFNVMPIYENLKWLLLPDGNFVYPNGQDWELFRCPAWLVKHVLVSVWANDPEAWQRVRRTLETTEKMQARAAGGAIFYPGEYFFASTQTDILRALSTSWLSLQLAPEIRDAAGDRAGVRRWDSAKVILRRAPEVMHTVSWGAKIMAQAVPRHLDRLVSPHERNGVGLVRLAGGKTPLPLRLEKAAVREGTNWFVADLVVDHGNAVRATLEFRSEPNGWFVMKEQLVALTNITTSEIATGLIGIVNNPHWIYESGRRVIESAGGKRIQVPSGSGRAWDLPGSGRLIVDDVLVINPAKPLQAAYVAAGKAERGRVTDQLVLNHIQAERAWRRGEVISEYEVSVEVMGR